MTEGEPIRFAFEGPEGRIRITPHLFPDSTIDVDPADLERFAPMGTGIYGLQEHPLRDPFREGPVHEANGGIVFFDNWVSREDFLALTRVLEIPSHGKKYAAFTATSDAPGQEGYLTQLRLVSDFALGSLFDALPEDERDAFPEQDLSMVDALWAFIAAEKRKYGTTFQSGELEGKFGGDGYFAREKLSFGLMVENDYFNIYRIWSRAWLVTK